MNIGIFTDTYLPQVNGVVSSIVTLENQLRKQGHNVSIFTISHPKAEDQSPDIYRLPSMPFVFLKDHRVGLIYSSKVVRKIKKLKLDIILSQTEFSLGFFARLVSKKLHIPIVHTYHTMYEEYMHYISKGVEFSPELARKYSKKFCNHVSGVVAPTQKTKDLLRSYGVTTPIKVIPSGIDFSPFKCDNYTTDEITYLKQDLGVPIDAPVILFVGRVAKEKSIDLIIEALPKVLEKVPNAVFLIIGDGPETINLKKLATNLSVSNTTIFAGLKPWKDIGKYYQLGDVFVSASVSETQGLTFAEAMAASLPVVAKVDESVQGLVIDDYNGKLFETTDELAHALCKVIESESFRQMLAKNALTSVAPLSDELFGENAIQYYHEILELTAKLKQEKKHKKTKNLKEKNVEI